MSSRRQDRSRALLRERDAIIAGLNREIVELRERLPAPDRAYADMVSAVRTWFESLGRIESHIDISVGGGLGTSTTIASFHADAPDVYSLGDFKALIREGRS